MIFDSVSTQQDFDSGLPKIKNISGHALWDVEKLKDENGNFDWPPLGTLPDRFSDLPSEDSIVSINIEHWDRSDPDKLVKAYIDTVELFKDIHPDRVVGIYGELPKREYWTALKGYQSPEYAKWREYNNKLMPLAKSVDVIFPSLYTFYEDRIGWARYAVENISEAQRTGERVIPWLWPRYHGSNSGRAIQPIEKDYFKMQVELCLALCGDVCIWDSDKVKPETFSMDWYDVVQEML